MMARPEKAESEKLRWAALCAKIVEGVPAGTTQEEIAEVLGVSTRQWRYYLCAEKTPGLEEQARMWEAAQAKGWCGVDPWESAMLIMDGVVPPDWNSLFNRLGKESASKQKAAEQAADLALRACRRLEKLADHLPADRLNELLAAFTKCRRQFELRGRVS